MAFEIARTFAFSIIFFANMWLEMQSFSKIGRPSSSSVLHKIQCLQLCNMVDVVYTVVILVFNLENKNQNYQEIDDILPLSDSFQKLYAF